MTFELLTQKKTTTVTELPTVENKNNIFINQDLFLNPFLKKYEIKKYILLVRKESEFEIASYSGYLAKELTVSRFAEESVFINYLTERNDIVSRQSVLDYYNESVLLPKEYNFFIKSEIQLWQELQVDYFIPVFDLRNKLFAIMLCKTETSSIAKNDKSLFVDRVYYWAKSYYDMYIENESKRSVEHYKQFSDFICKISCCKNQEELCEHNLDHYMLLYKATRGIYFCLSNGYYIPVRYRNIDSLKSYPKSILEGFKQDRIIDVKKNTELGFEMGCGKVRIIVIDNKNMIMLNNIFPVKLDEQQYSALKNVSRRFLECVPKKL